jgi:hypothetical protein
MNSLIDYWTNPLRSILNYLYFDSKFNYYHYFCTVIIGFDNSAELILLFDYEQYNFRFRYSNNIDSNAKR